MDILLFSMPQLCRKLTPLLGISFVENVPKTASCLLFLTHLSVLTFCFLHFKKFRVGGGWGKAQAPSAPPPATGLVLTTRKSSFPFYWSRGAPSHDKFFGWNFRKLSVSIRSKLAVSSVDHKRNLMAQEDRKMKLESLCKENSDLIKRQTRHTCMLFVLKVRSYKHALYQSFASFRAGPRALSVECVLSTHFQYTQPGAHQLEPLSLILCLGVNPFASRYIFRTALRGGFAHPQFKDPIKTELC